MKNRNKLNVVEQLEQRLKTVADPRDRALLRNAIEEINRLDGELSITRIKLAELRRELDLAYALSL